jgi:hypothetical protein
VNDVVLVQALESVEELADEEFYMSDVDTDLRLVELHLAV